MRSPVQSWSGRQDARLPIPALGQGGRVACQLQAPESSFLNSRSVYGVHRACQTLGVQRGRGDFNSFLGSLPQCGSLSS